MHISKLAGRTMSSELIKGNLLRTADILFMRTGDSITLTAG